MEENPKYQIRNPKQIRNLKQIRLTKRLMLPSDFGFRTFDFRRSGLAAEGADQLAADQHYPRGQNIDEGHEQTAAGGGDRRRVELDDLIGSDASVYLAKRLQNARDGSEQ